MLYGFLLGREFKLSIAELISVFPTSNIVFLDKNILVLDGILEVEIFEKAGYLGGTIKIIRFEKLFDKKEIEEKILEIASKKEGKFSYGLSVYPESQNLKTTLNSLKKYLVSNSISSRFVNKDFKNLSSSQILGEKLVSKGTDFTVLSSKGNIFFGNSIWIQDIESYSKRDYEKERDMQVGMLPPKLSQMMINISKTPPASLPPQLRGTEGEKFIYDPFCGLGTVLIEAILMGYTDIYGSDLSDKMVEVTTENIKNYLKSPDFKLDSSNIKYDITKLNAKFINESKLFSKTKDFAIVTEGYLGEVMTKKNIDIERVKKQRESLTKLYESFFSGLKTQGFLGNIVISFPFWDIGGKYHYFEEIYQIIERYCNVALMLPNNIEFTTTKVGSLLYKRDNQIVGREIFKLKIKG